MSGATQTVLASVRAKAEALLGESLGEAGDILTELACERAMAYCNRTDIPKEMEQAVAAMLVELVSRESGVKSVTRGDTSVTFLNAKSDVNTLLAPWCRLGTVREA